MVISWYPLNNEDKKLKIENNLLFAECKQCDLASSRKKYQLLVKGIDAESFSSRYNHGLNLKYKIVNIIEIKRKDGKVLNWCKIELESKDEFESLINA